jgi:steroid delta-isomerase
MKDLCNHAVAEYFAAIRAMDVERWVDTFAADAVSYDPVGTPPLNGHEALRRFMTGITTSFQSIGLMEDCVFVNSDTAAAKWTGKAVGKNGKSIEFEGIDVIQVNDDGKIALVHAYWDPAPVMAILKD